MTDLHPLELSYRGKRTYLHGTDIYTHLVSLLPGHLFSSLSFHSLLSAQPDVALVAAEDLEAGRQRPDFRGEFKASDPQGQPCHGLLVESSRPVSARRDCNEPEILAAAQVDPAARTASLPPGTPGSAIEHVVFLNKKLHQSLLPPPATQWLFARLDLRRPLPEPTPGEPSLTVRMGPALGGQFTRSDILLGGEKLGHIFFALASASA